MYPRPGDEDQSPIRYDSAQEYERSIWNEHRRVAYGPMSRLFYGTGSPAATFGIFLLLLLALTSCMIVAEQFDVALEYVIAAAVVIVMAAVFWLARRSQAKAGPNTGLSEEQLRNANR